MHTKINDRENDMINKIKNLFQKKEQEISHKEKSDWVVGDFIQVNHDVEGQFIKGEIFKIISINMSSMFRSCQVVGLDGKVNGWGVDNFSFYKDVNSGYATEFNEQFVKNMTDKALMEKYTKKAKKKLKINVRIS